jgi:hypothetical protein
MTRIAQRLQETDRRIRDANHRIDLYRRRVASRGKNPALAEQAGQLLPVFLDHVRKLVMYRKRLMHALELETSLAPQNNKIPSRPPQLPRYMR